MTFIARDANGDPVNVATITIGGVEHQLQFAEYSDGSGGATLVAVATPMPVQVISGALALSASGATIGGVNIISWPALAAGANNIGTVNINTMPAATAGTDEIAAALATGKIMNGLTALTPKFAKIVASSSGATTIVSAVASKKIRPLLWSVMCNAGVNAKWQSHVTPTDLTGLRYFAANGGVEAGFAPTGRFETVAGEALDINLSAAIAVGGDLVYLEV